MKRVAITTLKEGAMRWSSEFPWVRFMRRLGALRGGGILGYVWRAAVDHYKSQQHNKIELQL